MKKDHEEGHIDTPLSPRDLPMMTVVNSELSRREGCPMSGNTLCYV
jgi:hypothetical protein